MVGKPHHHGSSSLVAEELNLLHRDGGDGGRGGAGLGQWKCRLLGSLAGLGRPRRARCVVCLQVQHVTGLPPAAEGRGVVVGWRGKGGEGEHTSPVRVSRGAAAFDEVFLNYFVAGGATLRSFAVWAALVDSASARGGDLGSFPVDLTEIATAESSNPRFGGKALSFPLGGAVAGAVLTVSVYCRVMEQEENHGGANGRNETLASVIGGEGEHTSPVRVSRGAAAFDEVFLNYFVAGGATLRSFAVWAALVDSASARGGDLGSFPVDLTEIATAESSNPRFGGKALSFPLGGAVAGAVLTVSVYCRVMEQEENHGGANGHARAERKNKGKGSYASCLPDLSCLRNRPSAAAAASGSARRAASLRSDRGGFITIENSVAEMECGNGGGAFGRVEDVDEEGAGFITMEKGTISSRSRSRRPVGEDEAGDMEDEKPCLLMELAPEEAAAAFDVEKVEEEFLAMLEDKYWARSKEIEKGLGVSLDMGLDLGLDLDSLIKDAEMELAKAEQAWRSKVGAAIVEEEEYKDLVRRWSARDAAAAACWPAAAFAFGSPI
uniref:C2 NT-type domain-containing protein n=1 Tax=Oryza punctata TaxID=4537 RepID=A0A0E0K6W4_ORYPU